MYFTIGQVQHNPLLSLDSYLPGIQESMRKSGYPDFKRGSQVAFNLAPSVSQDGTQVQAPPVHRLEQFLFINAVNTSAYVLLPNALSFQTTEYGTFESFSGGLKHGLEILGEAVGGLNFTERLGLRYLDAITPTKGENLRDYLAKELLGLPSRMANHRFLYSFAESMLIAEGMGQVVSRTIIQNGALGFPPDLQPQTLKVADKFRSISGDHAVIDTDGSLTARKQFDVGEMQRSFNEIHELIHSSFHATVTDHARATWDRYLEQ